MEVNEYLAKVAYIGHSEIKDDHGEIYYSNFDHSYITRVGMEEDIKYLADREITEELTHGVGFSPKDNKWYGWSHRAIYGFEVGSECKKGDCHYRASNEEDEIKRAIEFWSDEHHKYTIAEKVKEGEIYVEWEYLPTVPNKKLHNEIGGVTWTYDPNNFGRGEWTAKTMADAKKMAIDFNEGVS